MAALTTVPSATVKAALGESHDEWSLLVTSALINKWSKYKPVRGAWPGADDGKYGTNIYAGSNPHRWDYNQPGGGSIAGEPFRAGDFRGYEHSRTLAFPSLQCRDTDNSWDANLYPSGTPYMQRWYCRAYRSASSVVILPSDLGIDNFYVGVKVNATGGPWYKTFGQVKDLTWAKSWNISISTEISGWTGAYPSFANFPYHIGSVDWQLFVSYTAASDWTASTPTDILYFPGIADGGSPASYDTDGTNVYITSGSFTIKDWLITADSGGTKENDLVFNAAGGYSDVYCWCSYVGPPDWTASVITGGGWITLGYYDDGTPLVHPNLAANGNQLRITADVISDVSSVTCYKDAGDSYDWSIDHEDGHVHPTLTRSPDGLVRVSSNGVTQDISVSQGTTGTTELVFTYHPTGGGDFPPSSGNIDFVIKRGATVVYSGSASGQRAGQDNTVTVSNIGETALNTDYSVYITLVL